MQNQDYIISQEEVEQLYDAGIYVAVCAAAVATAHASTNVCFFLFMVSQLTKN